MSQKVFFNWQDNLKSFDFGQALAGILFPGRFTGFDTKSSSGLNLSLTHAGSGVEQTDINGVVTAKTGVWVSPQGSIIQEDATKAFGAVAANASGNPRIDAICGQYLKPPSASAAATYFILTGTPGANPAVPTLVNPEKQVILGTLYVPDGTAANLTSCIYTPSPVPSLGNQTRKYIDFTLAVLTNWTGDPGATSTIVVRYDLINRTIRFLSDLVSVDISSTALQLPPFLTPSKSMIIPVVTDTFTVGTTPLPGFLSIDSSGGVQLMASPAPNNFNDCHVYLKHLVISLD